MHMIILQGARIVCLIMIIYCHAYIKNTLKGTQHMYVALYICAYVTGFYNTQLQCIITYKYIISYNYLNFQIYFKKVRKLRSYVHAIYHKSIVIYSPSVDKLFIGQLVEFPVITHDHHYHKCLHIGGEGS